MLSINLRSKYQYLKFIHFFFISSIRSFARIHETNLKKQGVLALTFANEEDYNKIRPADKISIKGLATFAPKKPLSATVTRPDGSHFDITLNHSFNQVCLYVPISISISSSFFCFLFSIARVFQCTNSFRTKLNGLRLVPL